MGCVAGYDSVNGFVGRIVISFCGIDAGSGTSTFAVANDDDCKTTVRKEE